MKIIREFSMTVYGRPQQRGSKTPVRSRSGGLHMTPSGHPILRDDNKKSKSWMSSVSQVAGQEYVGPLMTGPIILSATFYFHRPKGHWGSGRNEGALKRSAPIYHAQSPDLAKLVRCLEDGLTGIIWKDDKLVFRYEDISRQWINEDGAERCEFTAKEIEV